MSDRGFNDGRGARGLFVVLAQDLARCWAHKMHLLASKAGHRLIVFGIVRNIFGHKTLNSISGVSAAKKEGCHAVSFPPTAKT